MIILPKHWHKRFLLDRQLLNQFRTCWRRGINFRKINYGRWLPSSFATFYLSLNTHTFILERTDTYIKIKIYLHIVVNKTYTPMSRRTRWILEEDSSSFLWNRQELSYAKWGDLYKEFLLLFSTDFRCFYAGFCRIYQ